MGKNGDRLSVMMIGSLPPIKGISRYCLELVNQLGRKIDVDFSAFLNPYPRLLYPGGKLRDSSAGIRLDPHTRVRITKRLTYWNPLSWLVEAARSKSKIIHYQWLTTFHAPIAILFLIAGHIKGKSVVLTAHNVVPHKRHPFDILITRLVFKLADCIIVHSTRNVLQALDKIQVPPDKIEVVQMGTLFSGTEMGSQNDARKRLDLPLDPVIVLFFGGIRDHKGLDILVRAFGRSFSPGKSILVIAGQDWGEWFRISRLISDLEIGKYVKSYIKYIEEREVATFFEAADLVVLPYLRFASQSGVGMTSVALGKPIIVSDVGGLPDLVYGKSCVTEPGNVDGLASCLSRLLDDPPARRRLALRSSRIAERFSWKAVSDRMIRIYTKLIS